MKRELPLLLCGIMGVIYILQSFIPHPPVNQLEALLTDWALIIIVFTMMLGVLNLMHVNLNKISKKQSGWGYAAVTVIALVVTMFVGFYNPWEDSNLSKNIIHNNPDLIKAAAIIELKQQRPDINPAALDILSTAIVRYENGVSLPSVTNLDTLGISNADFLKMFRYKSLKKPEGERVLLKLDYSFKDFMKLYDSSLELSENFITHAVAKGRFYEDVLNTQIELIKDDDDFIAALSKSVGQGVDKAPELLSTENRRIVQLVKDKHDTVISSSIALTVLKEINSSLSQQISSAYVENKDMLSKDDNINIGESDIIIMLKGRTLKDSVMSSDKIKNAVKLAAVSEFDKQYPNINSKTLAGAFFKHPMYHLNTLESDSAFQSIFHNIFYPLSSTMFALLAFFIASAAYRAFRARSLEAALLLIAGFIVMLGQIPVGNQLTSWLPQSMQMSDIADWIMLVPNMASQRAIMIGVALGVISTAIKVILGIEKGWLGGGD